MLNPAATANRLPVPDCGPLIICFSGEDRKPGQVRHTPAGPGKGQKKMLEFHGIAIAEIEPRMLVVGLRSARAAAVRLSHACWIDSFEIVILH